MTIKRLVHVMAVAGLLGAYGTANAVSITAIADNTGPLVVGDTTTVSFFADFSDDLTLGGTFDILFDAGVLAVVDYQQPTVGDPGFFVPGTITDGNIVGGGFGDFGGLGDVGLVAAVTFEVIGVFVETGITMQNGTGGGGPFFSAITFQEQVVNYDGSQAVLTGVPLPAAVWLMIGGLGALFGFGRKKA